MAIRSKITPPAPEDDFLEVVVLDSAEPKLRAAFTYAVVPADPPLIYLVGIAIGPRSGTKPRHVYPLDIKTIRELSLTTWETAARARLVAAIGSDPNLVKRQRSHRELAELVTRATAAKATGRKPGPARNDERLAKVAADYRRLVLQGRRDPVKAIAEAEGVSRGTAGSWVHRARRAGLLDSAIGRTAGETSKRRDGR